MWLFKLESIMGKLLLLFIIICANVEAQENFKLIEARQQSWAGGVAGRRGENYELVLQSDIGRKRAIPDSVWIDNRCFEIVIKETGPDRRANTIVERKNGKIVYTTKINVDLSNYNYPFDPVPPLVDNCSKPREGKIVVGYRVGKKKRFLIINEVKILPPLNYP
jgi:hypothetical protein